MSSCLNQQQIAQQKKILNEILLRNLNNFGFWWQKNKPKKIKETVKLESIKTKRILKLKVGFWFVNWVKPGGKARGN